MALTNTYGVNYKKAYVGTNGVFSPVAQGEQSGKVKIAYDSITFDNNVVATTDVIYLMKLPAGAKIVDAILKCEDLGTTGVVDVGFSSGSELFASADVKAAAIASHLAAGSSAHLSTLTAEKQVTAKFSEATDAALNKTLQLVVFYVVE